MSTLVTRTYLGEIILYTTLLTNLPPQPCWAVDPRLSLIFSSPASWAVPQGSPSLGWLNNMCSRPPPAPPHPLPWSHSFMYLFTKHLLWSGCSNQYTVSIQHTTLWLDTAVIKQIQSLPNLKRKTDVKHTNWKKKCNYNLCWVSDKKEAEYSDNDCSSQEGACLQRQSGPTRLSASESGLFHTEGEEPEWSWRRAVWELPHFLPFLLL